MDLTGADGLWGGLKTRAPYWGIGTWKWFRFLKRSRGDESMGCGCFVGDDLGGFGAELCAEPGEGADGGAGISGGVGGVRL